MGEELFGSGGGNVTNKVAIPETNEQRRQHELNQFYAAFGGGPNSTIQNQGFQDSLRGYYGGAPFQDIAKNFASVNSFLPKNNYSNGYRMVTKPVSSKPGLSSYIPGAVGAGLNLDLF